MELKFTPTEVPAQTVTRTPRENPFAAYVPAILDASDKGQAVSVNLKTRDDAEKVTRGIRSAVTSEHSIRAKITENAKDVTLTLWAVAKIRRPRKG